PRPTPAARQERLQRSGARGSSQPPTRGAPAGGARRTCRRPSSVQPSSAASAPSRRGALMLDRTPLRLAATLLFLGVLLSFVAGMFHPARENPNDHRAVFAEYAASA